MVLPNTPHPSLLPHQTLSLLTAHALLSTGFHRTTSQPLDVLTTVLERYIEMLARGSVELAAMGVGRGGGKVQLIDVVEVLGTEMRMGSGRIGREELGLGLAAQPPPTTATTTATIGPTHGSQPTPSSHSPPELPPSPSSSRTDPLARLLAWVDEGEWGRAGDGENCLIDGLETVALRNRTGLLPVYPGPNLPSLPPQLTRSFRHTPSPTRDRVVKRDRSKSIPPREIERRDRRASASRTGWTLRSGSGSGSGSEVDVDVDVAPYGLFPASPASSSSSCRSSESDDPISRSPPARRQRRRSERMKFDPVQTHRPGDKPQSSLERSAPVVGELASPTRQDERVREGERQRERELAFARDAQVEVVQRIRKNLALPDSPSSSPAEMDLDDDEVEDGREIDDRAARDKVEEAIARNGSGGKRDIGHDLAEIDGGAIAPSRQESPDGLGGKRKRDGEDEDREGDVLVDSQADSVPDDVGRGRATAGLGGMKRSASNSEHSDDSEPPLFHRHHRRRRLHSRKQRRKDLLHTISVGMFARVKAIEEDDDGDNWGGVLPPLPGTEDVTLENDDGVKMEEGEGETAAMHLDKGDSDRERSVTPLDAVDPSGGGRRSETSHVPEQALEAIAVASRSPYAAYTMDPIPYARSALSTAHSASHLTRSHRRLRTRDPPRLYHSTLPSLLEAFDAAQRQTCEPNISSTPIYRKRVLDVMSATTADPLLYERAGTTLVPIGFASSTSGAMPKGSPFVPSYPIYGKNSLPVNAEHEADKNVPEVYPTRPVSVATSQPSYLARGMSHPPPSTLNPLEPRVLRNMLAEIAGDPAKPETSKTPYLTAEILAELTSLRPPPPLKREGDNQPALYGDAVFAPGQLDAEGQAKAKKLKLQKEKTLKLKLTLGGGSGTTKGKSSTTTAAMDEADRDEIYLGATWDIGDAGDWTKWNGIKGVDPKKILSSARHKSLETHLEELNAPVTPTPVLQPNKISLVGGSFISSAGPGFADGIVDPGPPALPTPKIRLSFGRPSTGVTTPVPETPSPGGAIGSPHDARMTGPTLTGLAPPSSSSYGVSPSNGPSTPSTNSYFDARPPANERVDPNGAVHVRSTVLESTIPLNRQGERPSPATVDPAINPIKLTGLAGLPAKPQGQVPSLKLKFSSGGK